MWEPSRLVEISSKNAAALNTRGACWFEKGNLEEAAADYDRAVAIAPYYSVAFANRAALRVKQEKYDAAVQDYSRAVALDPGAAATKNDLAWFLLTCPDESFQDPKRAVTLAEEACEGTLAKDWNMLHTLATAYARVGETDKAATTLRKALSEAPETERPPLQKLADELLNQKPAEKP